MNGATYKSEFSLVVPQPFNLWATAQISGWGDLLPFALDSATHSVHRILQLKSGQIVRTQWQQVTPGQILVKGDSLKPLDKEESDDMHRQVAACLRLDEDYEEFYERCAQTSEFQWVHELAAGRPLRAPTVWEDLVKTICTTNCSWSFTKLMARNLCMGLGQPFDAAEWTFPAPQTIAQAGDARLRELKLGYRSAYLSELARQVTEGNISLEAWRSSPKPMNRLQQELAGIRGLGPYGVAYMLNWVGRYEVCTVDRWMRRKFAEKHNGGKPVSDSQILDHYREFGRWKGLFFWVDMTREWLTP